MIDYKAEAAGITVAIVKERYNTQACPNPTCDPKYKPKGRVYQCPACGFVGHRDIVGAVNILSIHLFDELARVPIVEPKYRFAYRISRYERSTADTRRVD